MSQPSIPQQIAELTRRLTVVEGQLEANRNSWERDRTPMSLHDFSQQIAELTRRLTALEANRSSRESDRTSTHTSDVTSAPTGTRSLPGRDSDSVRQPNETESATPGPNYSKRPFDKHRFSRYIS